MGCDIHSFAERKRNGKWEKVEEGFIEISNKKEKDRAKFLFFWILYSENLTRFTKEELLLIREKLINSFFNRINCIGGGGIGKNRIQWCWQYTELN